MKSTVYLESSVISYLTARPSRDLVTAANQQLTHDWWDRYGENYDLLVSEAVITECGAGDPTAAQERLDLLADIPTLAISEAAEKLAKELVHGVPLPQHAEVDALHIAIAAVNGVEYLLTWNCTHLANAVLLHRIEAICRTAGYDPPTICTPQQLMEA